MKHLKSIKQLTMALLTVALFAYACTGNSAPDANTHVDNQEEVKPKAPAMDINTAVFMSNIKAVEQHVAAGSDLNKKDQYGSTPLHIAATFNRTDIAIALIKGGAELNNVNAEGSTPLHVSSFFCYTEIVEALLKAGADKEVVNNYGATALQSVAGPFADMKPIYDGIGKSLGPLGLKLDYDHLEKTRPIIAEMLN